MGISFTGKGRIVVDDLGKVHSGTREGEVIGERYPDGSYHFNDGSPMKLKQRSTPIAKVATKNDSAVDPKNAPVATVVPVVENKNPNGPYIKWGFWLFAGVIGFLLLLWISEEHDHRQTNKKSYSNDSPEIGTIRWRESLKPGDPRR